MKFFSTILLLCLFSLPARAQMLDYLEKSTSEDIYTSHNFHASVYNDGYFYLAGEFWKDIAFGDFSVAFPAGEDDTTWSFILKVSEEGEVVDLWHFESDDFTRINEMQFDPTGQTLTLVGMFWQNMIYNDTELISNFNTDAFVLNLNTDGTLNWSQQVYAQSPVSWASGEALAIDENGKIYASFEAGGTITLVDQDITYEGETAGALIVSFSADGEVVGIQQWQMEGFETFVDITAMIIDEDGQLVIGGGMTGQGQLGEILFGNADLSNLQSFVIKENDDLSISWAKQYFGGNSAVSNLYVFNDQLYVSLQYANFLDVDDMQINGSGSWGDLAIVAVDDADNSTVVQNLRLAGNGGTSGVYAMAMTEYLGQLYIGGMYQGVVINDNGDFSMGVVGSADFQYPYILAIDAQGKITERYDFWGSQGPSRLRTLAASEHRLLFGGEFTQRVALQGQSIETVNSTLFYGSLWDGVSSTDGAPGQRRTSCVERVYPTTVQTILYIDAEASKEVRVTDATGRIVAVKRSNTSHINVAHLPAGVYYLNISCDAGTEVVQFIKG